MNRVWFRLYALVLVVALWVCAATACTTLAGGGSSDDSLTVAPQELATNSIPANWDHRWLAGAPCSPPCWEGITPGETSVNEAFAILQVNPLINSESVISSHVLSNLGMIEWAWAGSELGGQIQFETRASTIYAINVQYPADFEMQEVTEEFGPPTHVVARAYRGPDQASGVFYSLWMVYLDSGFAMVANEPRLDLQMRVRGPILFIPDTEGFAKAAPWVEDSLEWLVEWDGFRDFQFYCRDSENGGLCNTVK